MQAAQRFCQGISVVLFNTGDEAEQTAIKGREHLFIAITQCAQVSAALNVASIALARPIPSRVWNLIALSPIAISLLYQSTRSGSYPQRAVGAIYYRVGKIAKFVLIGSVCVLIAKREYAFLAGTCISATLIALDRSGVLPRAWRRVLHKYDGKIQEIARFILAGKWMKLFHGALILSCTADAYVERKKWYEIKYEPVTSGPVTADQIDEIDRKTLYVNKAYVHRNALPPVPDMSVDGLQDIFNEITWANHKKEIKIALKQDPQWKQGDENSDRDVCDVLIEKFAGYLKSLKNADEDIYDYSVMETYLKYIVHYSDKIENKGALADLFIYLSIRGSYCPSGLTQSAADVAFTVLFEDELAFEERVRLSFQLMRVFKIRQAMSDNSLIMEMTNSHLHNIFISALSIESAFGLPDLGAEQDEQFSLDGLARFIATHSYGYFVRHNIWCNYFQSEHHIQFLSSELTGHGIGSGLTMQEMAAWCRKTWNIADKDLTEVAFDCTPDLIKRWQKQLGVHIEDDFPINRILNEEAFDEIISDIHQPPNYIDAKAELQGVLKGAKSKASLKIEMVFRKVIYDKSKPQELEKDTDALWDNPDNLDAFIKKWKIQPKPSLLKKLLKEKFDAVAKETIKQKYIKAFLVHTNVLYFKV